MKNKIFVTWADFHFDLQRFDNYPQIDGLTFNTRGNYYEIGTPDALNALATYVNSGNNCAGLTFKVTADEIDLSGVTFSPIGNHSNPFRGTFDGNGKIISNLTINTPDNDNVGVFGYNYGTIKNVTLINANIKGKDYVGALVGGNLGTVTDCKVDGKISGNEHLGAVVGYNIGEVSNNNYHGNQANAIGLNFVGSDFENTYYIGADGEVVFVENPTYITKVGRYNTGTYFIKGNVDISGKLLFNISDEVNLILTDGCELKITNNNHNAEENDASRKNGTDYINVSSYFKTPKFIKRFYDAAGKAYGKGSTIPSGKLSALDGYVITLPDGATLPSGITITGNKVIVTGTVLDERTVSIEGGDYKLALDGSVTKPVLMTPAWTVENTNATLHADTSAGYNAENNEIIYSVAKTGETQIVLGRLIKNAKLNLPVNNILTLDAATLGTKTSIKSNRMRARTPST